MLRLVPINHIGTRSAQATSFAFGSRDKSVGPSANLGPRRPGGPARPVCVHHGGRGFFVLLGKSSIVRHLFPQVDLCLHLILGSGSFTARHRSPPLFLKSRVTHGVERAVSTMQPLSQVQGASNEKAPHLFYCTRHSHSVPCPNKIIFIASFFMFSLT